jgi:hypothetical protein
MERMQHPNEFRDAVNCAGEVLRLFCAGAAAMCTEVDVNRVQ